VASSLRLRVRRGTRRLTHAADTPLQARCPLTATTGTWTATGGRCATSSTFTLTRAAPAPRMRSRWMPAPRSTASAASWTARRWGCAQRKLAPRNGTTGDSWPAARTQVYVWCLRLGLPCPFSGSPPTLLTTRPA
jgi:hypothetical protein